MRDEGRGYSENPRDAHLKGEMHPEGFRILPSSLIPLPASPVLSGTPPTSH